jgi:hypothetical protein
MLEKLIAKNKNAVSATGRLVLGKTAMDVLMERAVKRLPFMSRMFQGNKIKNNELARLGVAEAALALQMQFAPDNEKLEKVATAMVDSALSEVVLESAVLKSLGKELEKLVP